MSESAPVAVFNLEKTIADFVFQGAIKDIEKIGERLQGKRPKEASSVDAEHRQLLGWLAIAGPMKMGQLMETTRDQTDSRLAPWAKAVLRFYAEAGVPIGLYSASVPTSLVSAYARGIEATFPGATIDFAQGKQQHNGRYEKDGGILSRAELMDNLAEQQKSVVFVADSFYRARYILMQNRRHLLVNPDSFVKTTMGRHFDDFNILNWERTTTRTTLHIPGEAPSHYNFTEPGAEPRFISDLQAANILKL